MGPADPCSVVYCGGIQSDTPKIPTRWRNMHSLPLYILDTRADTQCNVAIHFALWFGILLLAEFLVHIVSDDPDHPMCVGNPL